MHVRSINQFLLLSVLFAPILVMSMESDNYKIEADSINFLGGTMGSANYQISQTGGELGGDGSSDTYNIQAGYQPMVSGGSTLTLQYPATGQQFSPTIDILLGGQSNLELDWIIDSETGYAFSALGQSILESTPSNAAPEIISIPAYYQTIQHGWSVPTGYSAYGFSPEGEDIVASYRSNGSNCGSGDTLGNCWRGFDGVTSHLLAETDTAVTDRTMTIKLRVEVAARTLRATTYPQGYITVTVTAL